MNSSEILKQEFIDISKSQLFNLGCSIGLQEEQQNVIEANLTPTPPPEEPEEPEEEQSGNTSNNQGSNYNKYSKFTILGQIEIPKP